MARYNTLLSTNTSTVTAGTSIGTPLTGTFTTITGTAGTVTLPDPTQFSGIVQSFFNATGSAVTLSTPAGTFTGPGASGLSTQTFPNGAALTVASDGAKYILLSDGGMAIVGTTGVFNDATDSTTNATGSVKLTGGLAVNKNITIGKGGANTGLLNIEGATSGIFAQKAAATTTGYTVTWPAAVSGGANYALVSDATGVLSWINASPLVTQTTTNGTYYPIFTNTANGSIMTDARTQTSGLTFNPSTNNLLVAGLINQLRPESTVQTASYTLALTDKDQVVTFNNTSTVTVTVPANATVAFPIGTIVWICRIGSGVTTLAAAGGVTLTKTGNFGLYEEIYLRKRATDSWVVAASTTNGSGVFNSAVSTSTIAGNSVGVYSNAGNAVGSFTAS
jgi:hypothetical protein